MDITALPRIFAKEIHEGNWDPNLVPEELKEAIRIELNILKLEEVNNNG